MGEKNFDIVGCMKFRYDDGGRSRYFLGMVGDCVTRSFAIGLGRDYLAVYQKINELCYSHKKIRGLFFDGDSSARDGVYPIWIKMMGKHFGLKYFSRRGIIKNLKQGKYIVFCGEHLTCVKNGILFDTHDCSELEYYGYYKI